MRRFKLLVAAAVLCGATPAYAADCATALQSIFRNEGGYQCMRGDSGNWTGAHVGKGELKGTKYGIAASSYPKEDIKGMTLQRAAQIYRRDFWGFLRLDGLKSQGIATTILDTGVNCGAGTAAILVEKTVNILNGTGSDVPLNARITPAMVAWVNVYTKPREQRILFYLVFQALRSERYAAIARQDHNKRQFLEDWLLRTWG